MKKSMSITFVTLGVLVALSSCATIIKGGGQDVSISSNPNDANVVVVDHRNREIWNARTPTVVELDRARGYFRGSTYSVTVSAEGYQPSTVRISSGINGWYLVGNLFFGGFIGWLVVDPLTGAMYNLRPKDISVGLAEQVGVDWSDDSLSLVILLLPDLPDSVRPAIKMVHAPS